jgi:hypothetical protein
LVVLSSSSTLGLEFVPEKMLRVLPGTTPGDESTLEGAVEAAEAPHDRERVAVGGKQSRRREEAGHQSLVPAPANNEFDLIIAIYGRCADQNSVIA